MNEFLKVVSIIAGFFLVYVLLAWEKDLIGSLGLFIYIVSFFIIIIAIYLIFLELSFIKNKKAAYWFFFTLKPRVKKFSEGLGVLSLYLLISYLLTYLVVNKLNIFYEFVDTFIVILISISLIKFSIENWARFEILDKEIEKALEELPDEIIKNSRIENIIIRVGKILEERRFLNTDFLGVSNKSDMFGRFEDKEKIRKMIKYKIENKLK